MGVVRLIRTLPSSHVTHSVCSLGSNTEMTALVPGTVCHRLGIEGASHTAFVRLFRLFRRCSVDIAHVNNLAPWFDVAVASRLAGCRCIQTFHGIEETTGRLPPARRVLLQLAAYMTAAITAVGEVVADRLVQLVGVRRSAIRVIPNGVDTSQYAPCRSSDDRAALRKEAGMPPEGFIVACVAALRPVKDHAGLIESLAGMVGETGRKDIYLALVGDGELAPELKRLSVRLGVDRQTLFMGRRDDVPAILRAADAFALNSRTEGMSYAILEAMATGLPVVATDVGGNGELVRHGRDGFLVPRADLDSMGRRIAMLAKNSRLAAKLGRNGRRRIVQTYSVDRMLTSFAGIYDEICRA